MMAQHKNPHQSEQMEPTWQESPQTSAEGFFFSLAVTYESYLSKQKARISGMIW